MQELVKRFNEFNKAVNNWKDAICVHRQHNIPDDVKNKLAIEKQELDTCFREIANWALRARGARGISTVDKVTIDEKCNMKIFGHTYESDFDADGNDRGKKQINSVEIYADEMQMKYQDFLETYKQKVVNMEKEREIQKEQEESRRKSNEFLKKMTY